MRHFFTKILMIGLLGSTTNLALAQEDVAPAAASIVISSGLEGGGYWNTGSRLQSVASGEGLAMENQASIGSLANLRQLLDENSPVSLAFAQADALQFYLKDNPEAAQSIETLETVGQECVFIISGIDSKIRTDSDMQNAQRRMHLGIKSPNSGIRVTFDYMKTLIPELEGTTVSYGDAVEMMNQFAHRLTNIDKAVMVVQGPNERSPEIDMVIANPDKYRFVKLSDKRLTQTTASGQPIYQSMKVTPGAVAGADAVQTICVQGLLLANTSKLSPQQRSALTGLIDNHWAEVYPAPQ